MKKFGIVMIALALTNCATSAPSGPKPGEKQVQFSAFNRDKALAGAAQEATKVCHAENKHKTIVKHIHTMTFRSNNEVHAFLNFICK